MTEKTPMTGAAAEAQAADSPAPEQGRTLKRRLFVLRLAALGGAGSATAACVPQGGPVVYAPPPAYVPPQRVAISDADPSDTPGRGRGGHRGSGVTDNDPHDAPGFGRGGYRYTSGVSDNDPSDPPGRGRGGGYRGTGVSDSDPSDAPGRGRGGYRAPGYRTGTSDSDPYDAPGRGRRGW